MANITDNGASLTKNKPTGQPTAKHDLPKGKTNTSASNKHDDTDETYMYTHSNTTTTNNAHTKTVSNDTPYY